MKAKPFIISSLLAAGTVLLFSKKEQILTELNNTNENLNQSKDSLTKIKQSLSTIQDQKLVLKDITKDLNYKFQVFNNDQQAHLNEIQTIANKYQKTDSE